MDFGFRSMDFDWPWDLIIQISSFTLTSILVLPLGVSRRSALAMKLALEAEKHKIANAYGERAIERAVREAFRKLPWAKKELEEAEVAAKKAYFMEEIKKQEFIGNDLRALNLYRELEWSLRNFPDEARVIHHEYRRKMKEIYGYDN